VSKLTREDKIKIYERRKKGETIPSLAKNFDVQESNIKYLITLIKKEFLISFKHSFSNAKQHICYQYIIIYLAKC